MFVITVVESQVVLVNSTYDTVKLEDVDAPAATYVTEAAQPVPLHTPGAHTPMS